MIIKKILKLLSSQDKKKAIFLVIMTLVMAFIEIVGVASIMPFIAVLANPEIIETNYILSKVYLVLNFNNKIDFIIFLGYGALGLLIFSLAFKSLTTYLQLKFALMHEYRLGKRLVEGYLFQPYIWFLNKNSSTISKNVLSEVSAVTNGCLMPMISLITQSAVALAIVILLLVLDPSITIIVGLIFGVSYSIIYKVLSSFLLKLGKQRTEANEVRFTIISEAFGAFKEVKVNNLEKFYLKLFKVPAKKFAENEATASIVRQLPRYALEMIAFGGMLLMIIYYISEKGSFINAVPIIALYAFAGYRFLPAVQQIYSSLTQLKFISPVLDSLYIDLINLEKKAEYQKINTIKFNKSIELKNIDFSYPNVEKKNLENINLTIKCRQKIGIVGGTGSGKTTTVDLILSLLHPQKGSLLVDDVLINNENKRSWQSLIGYVPQQIYLSDNSIASNIAFGVNKEKINYEVVKRVSKMANLHEFVTKELNNDYNTIVGEHGVRLSGGQRQRIGIARALYHQPELLIFDEATNALDNLTEQEVIKAIDNLNNKITVIMIAHRLNTVRNCDKIFLLDKGRLIAEGNFDDLRKQNNIFNKMVLNNQS